MKKKALLILIAFNAILLMMISCNNSTDPAQKEQQDSIMKVRNDSIRQAELDSLQQNINEDLPDDTTLGSDNE